MSDDLGERNPGSCLKRRWIFRPPSINVFTKVSRNKFCLNCRTTTTRLGNSREKRLVCVSNQSQGTDHIQPRPAFGKLAEPCDIRPLVSTQLISHERNCHLVLG